jgi:hypothetical protein
MDVVGTQLVRNQRRVSVDYLVRNLFLQDTLDRSREKVESDPDNLAADRPHNRKLAAVELAGHISTQNRAVLHSAANYTAFIPNPVSSSI